MRLKMKSLLLMPVLMLAAQGYAQVPQELDCSRYAERLDELELFMRQNPTPQQQRYFQARQQELVGGQAVCQRGTRFSPPEPVGGNTPVISNTPVVSQPATNPQVSPQVQPIYAQPQQPQQQPVVITQPEQAVGNQATPRVNLQQEAASQPAQPAQPAATAEQKEAPRLPPGMSKEQYYQSLCKLARDTYEDDPSDRNRQKVARFCQ